METIQVVILIVVLIILLLMIGLVIGALYLYQLAMYYVNIYDELKANFQQMHSNFERILNLFPIR